LRKGNENLTKDEGARRNPLTPSRCRPYLETGDLMAGDDFYEGGRVLGTLRKGRITARGKPAAWGRIEGIPDLP